MTDEVKHKHECGCHEDHEAIAKSLAEMKAKGGEAPVRKFKILPTVVMKDQNGRLVRANAADQMRYRSKGYEVVAEENMSAPTATPGTVPKPAPVQEKLGTVRAKPKKEG